MTSVAAFALLLLFSAPARGAEPWRELAPGLELADFASAGGEITVLRVEPRLWELTLHSIGAGDAGAGRSARAWAEAEGLAAATNAGMYAADYRTHVGLLQAEGIPGNPRPNGYQSVAAFAPRRAELPPFRIFDLEDARLEEIRRDYARVVQNLRLVKRPAENRWVNQGRPWSEAALGEDEAGRTLLLFSRQPRTMHDFIAALLALPLGLVAAQHLEGGAEAQLWVGPAGGAGRELIGLSGADPEAVGPAWPLPNVIGVRARPTRRD